MKVDYCRTAEILVKGLESPGKIFLAKTYTRACNTSTPYRQQTMNDFSRHETRGDFCHNKIDMAIALMN